MANCGFCPQARESHGRSDMLSRVSWPAYSTKRVLDGIAEAYKHSQAGRVCVQAMNYPEVFDQLAALVHAIHTSASVPISISCQPMNSENLKRLADAGAERIGIPLDAATRKIFEEVKGASAGAAYTWEKQFRILKEAVRVFGRGHVSTHLIVGLGETEREMAFTIQECRDMGVLPALFAFTPVPGTALQSKAPPLIQTYRRIQTARYLVVHGLTRCENMSFDERGCLTDFGIDKQTLSRIFRTGEPFLTTGCPDCNRPYYNEKPSGPIYNYPRRLTQTELSEIQGQTCLERS